MAGNLAPFVIDVHKYQGARIAGVEMSIAALNDSYKASCSYDIYDAWEKRHGNSA